MGALLASSVFTNGMCELLSLHSAALSRRARHPCLMLALTPLPRFLLAGDGTDRDRDSLMGRAADRHTGETLTIDGITRRSPWWWTVCAGV